MTVWHWVRHGPTHQKTFVGWRDVPADLSDSARIARLRAHLPKQAVVVSSDLVRATATADVLMQPAHRRLAHRPNLREIDFGAWDGLHFDVIAARDADLSRAFWETPGDIRAPDGESWNMASERVARAVAEINAAHPDTHVIAVAHFGVILTQVQRALRQSAYDVLAQRIDNLSVTRIEWRGGTPHLAGVNHCP